MDVWSIVSVLAGAVGTIVAAIALIVTVSTQKKQQELTKTIHADQTLLQQRQLLVPMWEYMTKTSFIDTSDPVWVDVRNTANTLELVAVSWEGGLIDPDIIRRIFGDTFIELYETIEQCQNPPANFPIDGRALLRRSPATQKLYQDLKREYITRGQIPPMSGQRK